VPKRRTKAEDLEPQVPPTRPRPKVPSELLAKALRNVDKKRGKA